MKYGSVCSGGGTCAMAFVPLGIKAAWFAEIEPAPSAVLAHHWPDVPNLGDMTTLPERILAREVEAPDILMGGTPCQAFSVAGLRRSLDDLRGNLTMTFVEIANAIDAVRSADGSPPLIILWENVPGVLSVEDNAFGCFLGALAGSGAAIQPYDGRWTYAGMVSGPCRAVAWRTMDAQYQRVAQRRRRVFVVAGAGAFRPEAVLFESEGVRRDSPPSREAWEDASGTITGGARQRGGRSDDDRPLVVGCLAPGAHPGGCTQQDAERGMIVGVDAYNGEMTGDVACTVPVKGSQCAQGPHAIAFHPTQDPISSTDGTTHAIGCGSKNGTATVAVSSGNAVRRLTPRECERLQGWPDDHTMIPYGKRGRLMKDGPRYKIIGNGWALPCVQWIGRRIIKECDRKSHNVTGVVTS